jgi:uncharacterized protein (TIGR03000 family)
VVQPTTVYHSRSSSPTPAPAPPAAGNGSGAAGGTDAIPPLPSSGTSIRVDADAVLLNVSVPTDAVVFVNGYKTNSTGISRSYVSRGLTAGRRYKYEIRAEVQRDGETVSDRKIVYVTGGDRSNLAFRLDAPPTGQPEDSSQEQYVTQPEGSDEPLKTTLRLRVPADAIVTLGGRPTASTGATRVYTTTRLTEGQSWKDYVVRASVTRNGRTLAREEKLNVLAGETRDLTIDFETADAKSIASAATR